jgi:hypothetical protein
VPVQKTEKGHVKNNRRFTGRPDAPNTGKVIEIAKEKGHWKKQDAEQGKQAEIQARSDASPGHIDIHTNNRPPPRGAGRKRPRLGFQP